MLRVQDIGVIAYGGGVTLAEWWDNRRINAGKLTDKDVIKKASFYTYLAVGLLATLMSVFGWMRRYERWAETVSHGFMYDLPRFIMGLTKSLGSGSQGSRGKGANSQAVLQAQRIMQAKQLTQGQSTQRTYEQEFSKVGAL